MHLRHRWSRWERYRHYYEFLVGRSAPKSMWGQRLRTTDLRQRRTCFVCGKLQDELLVEGFGELNGEPK